MKKILTVIFVLVLMMNIIAVVPADAKALDDGIYSYELLDDGTIEITNYKGNETNVTIPDTIGGYKVTQIGYCAFSENEIVTSVKIPNGVAAIDIGAFSFCEKLEEVYVPKSVKNIRFGAFLHCPNLKNIILGKNVLMIDEYALGYHTNYIAGTDSYVVSNIPMSDFSITGFKNTTAQTYADGNKIKFNSLTCYGDADGDGKVSISDVTDIQKHIARLIKLDSADLYLADVNGDGVVNIYDATLIQKYLAQLVDELG